jgi:universal stress protein A
MQIRKILCAVDFSEPSRAALHMAADMAQKFDAELTLLHVYQVPAYPLPDGVILPSTVTVTDLFDQVDRALADWRADVERLGAKRVKATSVEGQAWREIVAQASEGDFDLVVVGTHGHTGIKHLLLGSVAERVVRQAPCPVLAVRATPEKQPAKRVA